jgi:hypothetical protein
MLFRLILDSDAKNSVIVLNQIKKRQSHVLEFEV